LLLGDGWESISLATSDTALVRFGPPWLFWLVVGFFGVLGGLFVALLPPFAALAALAGVIVGAWMLVSPQAALLVFCGVATLLPFGVIPVKLGVSLTFLDAVLGVLTLVSLLQLLLWSPQQKGAATGIRGAPKVMGILLVLWVGGSLASFLTGAGFSVPQGDVIRFYGKVVLATLLFLIVSWHVRDRARLRELVTALVVGGGGAAALGVGLYVIPRHAANQLLNALRVVGYPTGMVLRFRVDFNHAQRAISTSIDPNVLGGLLVLTGALALSQLFAREPLVPRWLSLPASGAILLCLPLTYSRGAWISLGVALLFMAAWQFRALLVVAVVALLIFVQLPISQTFTTQLESGVQVRDKAAGMRVGEIKDSLRLIQRYPVFGVGFGSAPDSDLYVGVSNIYLLIAEQTGLVGLALILGALGVYLLAMLDGLPKVRDPALRSVAIGLFGATIGALTSGLFDRYFFSYPHDIALFWCVIALGLATLAIDRGLATPNSA
jgi:hypothetical protein